MFSGDFKAIHEQMPLLGELGEALKERVDIPGYVTASGDNVELWLTYLSQTQPWISQPVNLRNKALFLELTQEIGFILKNRESTQGIDCPPWLMSLVSCWHKSESIVITLNYDTLIERVARMIKIGDNDSLAHDQIYPVEFQDVRRSAMSWGSTEVLTFTLAKLHGSVNWYYSGADSYYGEPIYSSPVAAWDCTYKCQEDQGLKASSDKVPLIVPPTTEKVLYFQHETMRRMWATAGEALQSATHLVCIGYSLPVTDLSLQFFLRSCRQHGKIPLTIVNKDEGIVSHYRNLLKGFYQINSSYSGSNAVMNFVNDFCTMPAE